MFMYLLTFMFNVRGSGMGKGNQEASTKLIYYQHMVLVYASRGGKAGQRSAALISLLGQLLLIKN